MASNKPSAAVVSGARASSCFLSRSGDLLPRGKTQFFPTLIFFQPPPCFNSRISSRERSRARARSLSGTLLVSERKPWTEGNALSFSVCYFFDATEEEGVGVGAERQRTKRKKKAMRLTPSFSPSLWNAAPFQKKK